jgi:ABC-type lipoprotein export system ATPase subunit
MNIQTIADRPAATPPIVTLTDVWKSYDTTSDPDHPDVVLEEVDLAIHPGDKISLVGPSGSGKSTLLMLIAGLLRPDRGAIEIDAIATDGLSDRARARLRADRIGIALQADNLIPFLSARENVELALGFGSSRRRGQLRHRAVELLDRFGVAHRARHRPRHLSGGEAQRVALAVSMANEPGLLLADEVVAQLDSETATGVIDEVLAEDFAVLYVTHDVAIADLADRRYALTNHAVVPR